MPRYINVLAMNEDRPKIISFVVVSSINPLSMPRPKSSPNTVRWPRGERNLRYREALRAQ